MPALQYFSIFSRFLVIFFGLFSQGLLFIMTAKIINQFYESGGVKLLCSMVLEHSEDSVRSVTAKALVIIARRSPEHRYYILTAAVMPLLRDTMQLISDCLRKNMAERGSATDRERDSNTEPSGSGNTVPLALTSDTTMSPDPVEAGLSMNMELTEHEKSVKMYQKMSTALVNLNTFLYTTIFDDGPDSEMVNFETMVGESLSGIAIGILDLHIMPLLKELSPTSTVPPNVELNVVADAAEDNSISVPTLDDVQVEGDAPSTTGTTQKDTATLTDNTKKDSATTTDGELTFEEQEEEIQAQKDAVTINAFKVISCLCRYGMIFCWK